MDVVTKAEAMVILKVGHTKLWEMGRDGKINPIRRDGKVYFDRADLDAYWEALKRPKITPISYGGTLRKRRA